MSRSGRIEEVLIFTYVAVVQFVNYHPILQRDGNRINCTTDNFDALRGISVLAMYQVLQVIS